MFEFKMNDFALAYLSGFPGQFEEMITLGAGYVETVNGRGFIDSVELVACRLGKRLFLIAG